MGVNLRDIITAQPIDFADLEGKIIAVDALNTLYQFLATIRQPDGTPLQDSAGNITSHLSGLLYRTIRLINLGIKPIYVFDGIPPELKRQELRRRKEIKLDAQAKMEQARAEGRIEDAGKYAKRTSRLTDEMLTESKELLKYMGVPYVQAPSEGEAQCVYLTQNEPDVWAAASSDYDTLLFGAPRLVRGLTLSGTMELTMIEQEKVLGELELSREQLIDLAILVGTDFNPGVAGIGPKKALMAVKEDRVSELISAEEINPVRELFLNHPVVTDYDITYQKADKQQLTEFLHEQHEFSKERIEKAAKDLEKAHQKDQQKSINQWF